MALEAMTRRQHDDINTVVARLRAQSQPSSRQLAKELLRARAEEDNLVFTAQGVRSGGWLGYLSRLFIVLFAYMAIGCAIIYTPWRLYHGFSYRIGPFDGNTFTRLIILLSFMTGWVKAGRQYLRRRGWLIMAFPLIAGLAGLYYAFF